MRPNQEMRVVFQILRKCYIKMFSASVFYLLANMCFKKSAVKPQMRQRQINVGS